MMFLYSMGNPPREGMEFWVRQQSERKTSPHTARIKLTFRNTGHRLCSRSMERLSLAKVRVCVQLNCLISLGSRARKRQGGRKKASMQSPESWPHLQKRHWVLCLSTLPQNITQSEASVSIGYESTLAISAKSMWGTRGIQLNYQHCLTSGERTLESGEQLSVKHSATPWPSHASQTETKVVFASYLFPKRWGKVLVFIGGESYLSLLESYKQMTPLKIE